LPYERKEVEGRGRRTTNRTTNRATNRAADISMHTGGRVTVTIYVGTEYVGGDARGIKEEVVHSVWVTKGRVRSRRGVKRYD